MVNQTSKDIYIHLNSRELKARHVNRSSSTQCNSSSRFRHTVLFGVNVQDTIKYLPFGMSGTVAESVTDATLLFIKKKTLQQYNRQVLYMGLRSNVVIISSTLRAKENKVVFRQSESVGTFSRDITKTNDPSPPTPNKVEFGAKWVKMRVFFGHNIAKGSGGTTG